MRLGSSIFGQLAGWFLILWPLTIHAQEADPLWRITTLTGESYESSTLAIANDVWLLGRKDELRRFRTTDLLSITRRRSARSEIFRQSPAQRWNRVLLANGDVLYGTLLDLTESRILLKPVVGFSPGNRSKEPKNPARPLEIRLESVAEISWFKPTNRTFIPPQQRDRKTDDHSKDRIELSNGDRLVGELVNFSIDRFVIENEPGRREIPVSEIEKVVFNPELVLTPPPLQETTEVRLKEGSRITVKNVELLDFNRLRFETQSAGRWELPVGALNSYLRLNAKCVPLSQRKPTQVKYTPFLGDVRVWRADRNVLGGFMVMQGREYLTGVGMHSRTEVRWSLDDDDRTLIAEIGLDDSANQAGSVVFEIVVDGESIYRSPVIRGGQEPIPLTIDLQGRQDILLRVDFGDRGDVCDWANWGHALILKQASH